MLRARCAVLLMATMFWILPACRPQEDYERPGSATASAVPEAQRIDINHATLDELMKVRGMTTVWAQRIVRFRPYHSKQDLVDQGVLPAEVYSRFRDFLIAHREKAGAPARRGPSSRPSAPSRARARR